MNRFLPWWLTPLAAALVGGMALIKGDWLYAVALPLAGQYLIDLGRVSLRAQQLREEMAAREKEYRATLEAGRAALASMRAELIRQRGGDNFH